MYYILLYVLYCIILCYIILHYITLCFIIDIRIYMYTHYTCVYIYTYIYIYTCLILLYINIGHCRFFLDCLRLAGIYPPHRGQASASGLFSGHCLETAMCRHTSAQDVTYIHIYIYLIIHIYVCVYIYIQINICIYIYMCTHRHRYSIYLKSFNILYTSKASKRRRCFWTYFKAYA